MLEVLHARSYIVIIIQLKKIFAVTSGNTIPKSMRNLWNKFRRSRNGGNLQMMLWMEMMMQSWN